MKKTNKIFSVVLAIVLVLATAIPAFAESTGKITISNAVAGYTYNIYKMLDFTPIEEGSTNGVNTVADGWLEFFQSETAKKYFTLTETDNNGETVYTVAAISETTQVDAELARAAVDYAAEKNLTATKSAEASGTTVEFSGLDLGYYAVDTTVGAICSLTNTDSESTLIEKNRTPELEKKIVEDGKLVDANNVAIGDTVTYQVTVTVGEGLTDYVIHDVMDTGLDYQGITSVTLNDAASTAVTDYNVITETEDGCTFEIAFDNDYINSLAAGTEIVVIYTATLNSNAVIGTTGNYNKASLAYKNETTVESTPEDIVITYTTELTVTKTDKDGAELEGAGFTLYKKDANGTYQAVGQELKTGATFVWTGLEEGDYKIVETTVPAGYNKADDIEFTISCTEPTEVKATTDAAVWNDTNEDDDVTLDDAGNGYETSIKNLTGTTLPETGGIGTTIFYIVGGLLVVGAAILLISKKKMSAEA